MTEHPAAPPVPRVGDVLLAWRWVTPADVGAPPPPGWILGSPPEEVDAIRTAETNPTTLRPAVLPPEPEALAEGARCFVCQHDHHNGCWCGCEEFVDAPASPGGEARVMHDPDGETAHAAGEPCSICAPGGEARTDPARGEAAQYGGLCKFILADGTYCNRTLDDAAQAERDAIRTIGFILEAVGGRVIVDDRVIVDMPIDADVATWRDALGRGTVWELRKPGHDQPDRLCPHGYPERVTFRPPDRSHREGHRWFSCPPGVQEKL